MFIKELVTGSNAIILLVLDLSEMVTKNKKPYLQLTLTDGVHEVRAKMWDTALHNCDIKIGSVYKFGIDVSMYNSALSYTVQSYSYLSEEDGVKVSDFIKEPPIDTELMYEDLLNTARNFDNKELTSLIELLYTNNKDKLLVWSAAKRIHHNYKGGLLYHNYRMTEAAKSLCRIYTDINSDLVIASCMLHDIGKLRELETDIYGGSVYTKEGYMFGHLMMGFNMIEEADRVLRNKGIEMDHEILECLKHIIVSHHGELEWGAIKKPVTIEAVLVHMIDLMDSRIGTAEDNLSKVASGEFTENIYSLGTPLYKM